MLFDRLSRQPFRIARTLGRDFVLDGADVLETKRALARLGSYRVPSAGLTPWPDRALFDGITSFQRRGGLLPDGIMRPGGPTASAIEDALADTFARVVTPSNPPKPNWAGHPPARLMPLPVKPGSPDNGKDMLKIPDAPAADVSIMARPPGFNSGGDRAGNTDFAGVMFDVLGGVGSGRPNESGDVILLKRALGLLGHYPANEASQASGRFDPVLDRAIRSFQKGAGVAADGWLAPGGETARVLNTHLKPTIAALEFAENVAADSAANSTNAGNAAGQSQSAGASLLDQVEKAPRDKTRSGENDTSPRRGILPPLIPDNPDEPSSEAAAVKAAGDSMKTDIKAFRAMGMDPAADNLERYLSGSGETKTYTREEARELPTIKDLEEESQKRFVNETFPKHIPEKFRTLEDGGQMHFKDKWDTAYNGIDVALGMVTGKVGATLTHGDTFISSSGEFNVERKGDKARIEGTVVHKWDDTYDFEKGQPGAGVSKILERNGQAKPFKIKAEWRQRVSGTARLVNKKLVVDKNSLKWEDINP